jgi:hypothetical protein
MGLKMKIAGKVLKGAGKLAKLGGKAIKGALGFGNNKAKGTGKAHRPTINKLMKQYAMAKIRGKINKAKYGWMK